MNVELTEAFLPLPDVLYLHLYYSCVQDKDEALYLITKRDHMVPDEDHETHKSHGLG